MFIIVGIDGIQKLNRVIVEVAANRNYIDARAALSKFFPAAALLAAGRMGDVQRPTPGGRVLLSPDSRQALEGIGCDNAVRCGWGCSESCRRGRRG